MTPRPPSYYTRIIYLLHLTNKQGEVRHYAGTTTRPKLKARLDRHRCGYANSRTRVLWEQGFVIRHVVIIPDRSWILERLLNMEEIGQQSCPICTLKSPYADGERYDYNPTLGDVGPRFKPFSYSR